MFLVECECPCLKSKTNIVLVNIPLQKRFSPAGGGGGGNGISGTTRGRLNSLSPMLATAPNFTKGYTKAFAVEADVFLKRVHFLRFEMRRSSLVSGE